MRSGRWLSACSLVLVAALVAACGGTTAAPGGGGAGTGKGGGGAAPPAAGAKPAKTFPGPVAALVQQAAKEGHLNLSWSSTFGGNNGKDLGTWMHAFNTFYGLHLTYRWSPAPAMTQLAGNLVQEAQSGAPAATDLYIGSSSTTLALIKGKAAKTYDWKALGKDIGVNVPAAAIVPGNAAVAFATEVYGIAYNKKAVPASKVPHTLAAVLQPQWKGKVASTPYASGFYQLAFFSPQWGKQKTTAYVTALAHQVGGLVRCGTPAPLLSGQYDMIVLDCDIASAIEWEKSGMPIGYVVPADAPTVDFWYFAVPKTSADPAAAALFTLFMLTKQGQSLSWQSDANDLILLPGSHDLALIPKGKVPVIGEQGVAGLMKHPDALKYYGSLIKILNHPSS